MMVEEVATAREQVYAVAGAWANVGTGSKEAKMAGEIGVNGRRKWGGQG